MLKAERLTYKFKTAQNSKNLRLNGHTSFESYVIPSLGFKTCMTIKS